MKGEGRIRKAAAFTDYGEPRITAACVRLLTCVGITLIDVGSTQQIVESADPVPSVTIAFQHNAMFAGLTGPAVVFSKKVHQQFALCAIYSRIHENFARLFVKIV